MQVLLMIFIAVALEVAGQTLYKSGLNRSAGMHGTPTNIGNLWAFAQTTVTNWRVMTGVLVYVAEVFLWWIVLSRVDVSWAFPLTSMSYVLLLLVARLSLHEHVTPLRWLGAATVMLGVYLITRSAPLPR